MTQTREFDIRIYKDRGYWWVTIVGYKTDPWPFFTAWGARRAAKRWCRREVRKQVKEVRRRQQNNFTYTVKIKEA